jgi:thiol peroxidase
MTTVRTDVFKLGDKFATLLGDEVKVGQTAPEFTSVVPGWGTVTPLEESKGKVIILSAVPSLDTDVCDRETRRFNEEAAKLSDDIVIYTISTDFPMAQKRWCGAAGVDQVKVVSDVLEVNLV